MPRPCRVAPRLEDLPTIWEVSDQLWASLAPVLATQEPSSVLWQQFLRMILTLLLDPFSQLNLHIE
jgi:hypothetical protein